MCICATFAWRRTRLRFGVKLRQNQKILDILHWPELVVDTSNILGLSCLAFLETPTHRRKLSVFYCQYSSVQLYYMLHRVRAAPHFSNYKRRHIAHVMLAVLAAMDLRERYAQLMAAFNTVRCAETASIPPIDEWNLPAFCNHPFCR